MRCARSFAWGFGVGPGGAGARRWRLGVRTRLRGQGGFRLSLPRGCAALLRGHLRSAALFGGRQWRLRRRCGLACWRSGLARRWPALRWTCLRAGLLRLLGRDHVDDRSDVQPRGLSEVAGLAGVVAGDGDHQVVAVDHHLGSGNAKAVDARGDDLLRLVKRVLGGPRSVRRTGRQCDPGAALQVDTELRLGLLVSGQKDQEVHADHQREEDCQVAGRVHRRRRRCHVSLVSSRSGRQHRKGYVAVLSARLSVVSSGGSGPAGR